MKIYTVHLPSGVFDRRVAAERGRLVREGFSFGAFFFGPIWLALVRSWLGFALWWIGVAAAILVGNSGHLGLGASVALVVLVAFLTGLEGNALRRRSLVRRGLRAVDIVAGGDRQEAERSFLVRWLAAESPATGRASPSVPPPLPPTDSFIGLFPTEGSAR
jgi:hypothetical protein